MKLFCLKCTITQKIQCIFVYTDAIATKASKLAAGAAAAGRRIDDDLCKPFLGVVCRKVTKIRDASQCACVMPRGSVYCS